MNNTWLNNLNVITNSPKGVEQLRVLILHLAFSGQLSHSGSTTRDRHTSWERRTIEAICSEITPGFACSKKEQASNGHVHLRTHNISTTGTLNRDLMIRIDPRMVDPAKASVQKGDILFNNTNSQELVGKTAIIDDDYEYGFSNHITRLRIIPGIDPSFVTLYLTFLRNTGYFSSICTRWINQAAINGRLLRQQIVPVPPLEEQKRIVAKVGELMRLCDRLEAQQQERAKLLPLLSRASHARFVAEPTEVNLRAIFHKPGSTSPLDFRATLLTLAVTGVLVTQVETDEHVSRHLSGPSLMSQPPSVSLPSKWMWVRVDEAGEVQLGRQRAPAYHKGPNMRPYLRVQNVYEARLDLSDVKSMEFDHRDFKTFRLRAGDILLNEGQSRELVGRPALYAGEIENACFQNTLIRFRHRDFVDPEFALLVFRAYMRNGRFQQIAKQTTNIAHLGAGRFSALEFPLPPLPEQRRIVAKAAELLAVVDRLETLRVQSRDNAGLFGKAAVAAITSTEFTENDRMKPPKTEVVTALKVGKKPKKAEAAPLATLLLGQKAEASAKTLWKLSGLEIDAFYRQLKTEMAHGWIDEDEDKRAVKEVEAQ